MALTMRVQLARPENDLIGPDLYNQLFTTHGSAMMFLFAVPIMEAVAVFIVPLMAGTRNIAFPRLNAFSYWLYLAGGLFLFGGFLLGIGPDVGWFAYVPLSGPEYSPGKRADFWAQMITFTEVAALAVSVELIVTTLKLRAPGMSLDRMPLFMWSMLVTSFMVLFAMPSVMIASSCLIMDRLIGTHFFNPAEGGSALLWQHLFWFFGHPEVYIIFIPALGMVSSIVATFSRRPVFGHLPMVLSLVATAFLGFGLWVHHMFATGLPRLGDSFFTAASMTIAIPSGIQIFCWIATIWAGKPVFKTPLLYVVGFVVIFVIGGLSGVMIASVPLDLQVHDTYFIVAHFHYVLIGGAVFPLFGAFYYWFPKFTGRMLHEGAGKLNFWLFFIGFNVAFFPMHILGLEGMPRRVYTYPMGMGWDGMNLTATLGAMLIALERPRLHRQRRLEPAPRDGRRRQSLGGQHARVGHVLAAARLQLRPHPLRPQPRAAVGGGRGAAGRLRPPRRPARAARDLDCERRAPRPRALARAHDLAVPRRHRDHDPVHRLGLHALGRRLGQHPARRHADRLVLAEGPPAAPPRRAAAPPRAGGGAGMKPRFVHDVSALPNHAFGRDSILWWGTLGFMAIEGTGFILAIAAYFYLMREVPRWPPGNIPPPGLLYGSLLTAVLLVSALPNHWAKQAGRRQDLRGSLLWMGRRPPDGRRRPRPARLRVHHPQHPLGQQRLRLDPLGAARPAHHPPRHRRRRHRRPARRPAARPRHPAPVHRRHRELRTTGTSSCSPGCRSTPSSTWSRA